MMNSSMRILKQVIAKYLFRQRAVANQTKSGGVPDGLNELISRRDRYLACRDTAWNRFMESGKSNDYENYLYYKEGLSYLQKRIERIESHKHVPSHEILRRHTN